jgi:hypothetical protein
MIQFDGSRLKIKRAKHHIMDLNTIVSSFLKTDFYSLVVDQDPQSGNYILKFGSVKSLPPDIPTIIGDAIHNMSSALDLIIGDIVWEKLRERPKRLTFPVLKLRSELIGIIKHGKIHEADSSLCDLIADVIKPYEGGNDPLLALHELDIIDKHRLVIPVIQATELNGVDFHDDNGNEFCGTGFSVDRAGHIFNAIETSAKIHIDNYGQPSFEVLFDQGLPLEGEPIIPTLHQFAQLVTNIVEIFEKHYA